MPVAAVRHGPRDPRSGAIAMTRIVVLVLLSISLSVAATLVATWASTHLRDREAIV
jgi:hypothetical protein